MSRDSLCPPSAPRSEDVPRIDGAYVIDEQRVDTLAQRAASAELRLLLPGWSWTEPPWPSLLD